MLSGNYVSEERTPPRKTTRTRVSNAAQAGLDTTEQEKGPPKVDKVKRKANRKGVYAGSCGRQPMF